MKYVRLDDPPFSLKSADHGFLQISVSLSLARGRAILVGPDACYEPVSGTARPQDGLKFGMDFCSGTME